jgi:glycine dehydrogenase subunit 1
MRYLPLTKDNRAEMLREIGAKSVDDLYSDVPKSAFMKGLADLPMHMGELEVERKLSAYANMNRAAGQGPFFLGAGCYFHHIPATVDYIIQRSEFLTAYTPYQPEIAQGTLQVIFEFQSMIALLTGQDLANASLYDGATSMAEAALMAQRITKRDKIIVGGPVHPQYVGVLNAYASGKVQQLEFEEASTEKDIACVIIQSPNFIGEPEDYGHWRELCDRTGALMIVVVNEILSLGLLAPPSMADIVCGEAQSIGVAMSFGGPHLGFLACKEKYLRQMPGRLCGQTVDADGKRGFVLTLSTREQHIRREKATSNICTNQGLCTLAFTVHMALLGEDGFKRLAQLNHERACALADALGQIKDVSVASKSFFNEFYVTLPKGTEAKALVETLAQKGIIAGYPMGNETSGYKDLLVAATEMTTDEDIAAFATALRGALS